MMPRSLHSCFAFLFVIFATCTLWSNEINVASKSFTESYILAEYISQTLESDTKHKINRNFGLGGTGIVFEALRSGNIDLYPEYTGTISEAILKKTERVSPVEISAELAEMGLVMSGPLGFNNTYALAVTKETASRLDLDKMSDLVHAPNLRLAMNHEFMERKDGFQKMSQHYGYNFKNVKVMEHSLSYEAIENRKVDLIVVYTTDAKIKSLNLVILKDDLNFFPQYHAVVLARADFASQNPQAWAKIQNLKNSIDVETMIQLNASVDIGKKSFGEAVANHFGLRSSDKNSTSQRVLRRTKEHLFLVGLSLAFSIVVGVPLGVFATRSKNLGQAVLALTGLVQTIPSLALLCFLIPIFGIGIKPALFALCLYSLLPVVMGTFVGIRGINGTLIETATAMGMSRWHRLVLIELPLASHSIVSGIKISMIIGIGTATLAALIGAGGYGAPILTGLALNDINMILLGAIPAAAMALSVEILFMVFSRFAIPKGLRV